MTAKGTYTHDKNENLGPFLKAIGVPDEKVEKMTSAKPTLTIEVEGGKIEMTSKSFDTVKNTLTLGAPSKFVLASGFDLEVTVNYSGSKATGTLKKGNQTGDFTIDFSDAGLVETFNVGGNTCKRFYKRS